MASPLKPAEREAVNDIIRDGSGMVALLDHIWDFLDDTADEETERDYEKAMTLINKARNILLEWD